MILFTTQKKRLLFLSSLVMIILILAMVLFVSKQKNKVKHLPLPGSPLTSTPSTPPTNLLFNTLVTPLSTLNIVREENLLFAITREGIINIQKGQTINPLTNRQITSIGQSGLVLKNDQSNANSLLSWPYTPNSERSTKETFQSPVIKNDGSALINCQNTPEIIYSLNNVATSKIKTNNPFCLWGYQNTVAIQDNNLAYLWDLNENTTITIGLENDEVVISSFRGTILTNKNGLLGIRTREAVNALPLHTDSLAHILEFDDKTRSFILMEVLEKYEDGRAYFYSIRLNENNFPIAKVIGSSHPIPENIDPHFPPIYIPKSATAVIRTVSGKYWLASLMPGIIPYLTTSGIETYEMGNTMFGDDH